MDIPFIKDIVIIDFEATGGDLRVAQPLQLGAILIDRETLKEKKAFSSFIAADLERAIMSERHKTHFAPHMQRAPSQAKVA